MKDVLPRIYRSLEKDIRRGGFDTIVTAATMSFLTQRAPGKRQLREFGDLVASAWPQLGADTQRTLAQSLASAPNLPVGIVDRICNAPLDIAAPFLRASPCLETRHLEALAQRPDVALHAILAERDAAKTVPVASTPTAIPAAAKKPATLPVAAQPSAPAAVRHDAAAAARAELFRLARPGRAPATPAVPTAAEAPLATSVSGLVTEARAGRLERFYAGLGRMLSLDAATLATIADDASGEWLGRALKVLRAGPTDALTAIMLVKPRIGADVAAFEAMKTIYRGLDVDDCRSRLGLARSRIMVDAPSLQPQSADMVIRPVAGAPRRSFGRRTLPPAVERSIGKR